MQGEKLKCKMFSSEGYYFEKGLTLGNKSDLTINVIDYNHPFFH